MTDSDISYAVTGLQGWERQVLGLRNSNRETDESMEYLNWRYATPEGAPAARIYWARVGAEAPIGVAAAIFRWYWIKGSRRPVAVIGDISVEANWRSKGVGEGLLRFMSDDIGSIAPPILGFVIPTEPARRLLERVGWASRGELVPWVYVLDLKRWASRVPMGRVAFRPLGRIFRSLNRAWLRLHCSADARLTVTNRLDSELLSLIERCPPAGEVTRDLRDSAVWRYERHPHGRFRFAVLKRGSEAKALVIFEEEADKATCTVYDIVSESEAYCRHAFARFVLRCMDAPELDSVRVPLDSGHPARLVLRRLGFLARPADAHFAIYNSAPEEMHADWRVTLGDKDT
ncbi:MAG: hypothetical protein JSS29_05165 [Proteobacteria bacterium]|nr:hypothetical protein [Pseudomonadota bacterium]